MGTITFFFFLRRKRFYYGQKKHLANDFIGFYLISVISI